MNAKIILETYRRMGYLLAADVQRRADTLDGTALNSEDVYIPDFSAACAKSNMLERPVGFVCKSSAGRVVKLLQPYDSAIYPGEPETLPAQWGFVWSTDPEKAREFVSISTSPYNAGDCCLYGGAVSRSLIDGNVNSPGDYPQGWEAV